MESPYINLEKGVKQLFNRNYEEALILFDRQITLTPETPEAYLYRGHTRFILNDISGACTDWRKAFSLGNTSATRYTDKYCR
jgi:Tfp pilus assembly protein PilF